MNRGQKIFNAFLIILASTILFLIPFIQAAEDLKTDQRTDYFNISTAVGITTSNITLGEALYDNDLTTIQIVSDLSTDSVVWASYNATDRHILISALTDNSTRTLTASYNVDALGSSAVSDFVDALVWIWLLSAAAFAPAALAGIFIGRN